jgi:hypothetical protein
VFNYSISSNRALVLCVRLYIHAAQYATYKQARVAWILDTVSGLAWLGVTSVASPEPSRKVHQIPCSNQGYYCSRPSILFLLSSTMSHSNPN